MKEKSMYCLKVGMTQVFDEASRAVVPVTVVNFGSWIVLQVKTVETDGYSALKVGLLKNKFKKDPKDSESLNKIIKEEKNFSFIKEIKLQEDKELKVGSTVSVTDFGISKGSKVSASGISKGLGFQGVMRRHGFAGGPKSHGSNFHRKPGSVGNIVGPGEVRKGKPLPGRCGGSRVSVKNVEVVDIFDENGFVFLRGSIPGKKNGLIFLRSGS